MRWFRLGFLILLGFVASATARAEEPLRFAVTYDAAIADSFTGRVYVMLTTSAQEPRFGPAWFGTQPFFALDVSDWKPGEPLVFDDSAIAFPGPVSQIGQNTYNVQALMRLNRESPKLGEAPGNAYSKLARLPLNGATSGEAALHIERTVETRPFPESPRVHLTWLRSDLLSDFHGRDIALRAAVILPDDYDQHPQRRYPALYWIGGFGSDHHAAVHLQRAWAQTGYANDIIRVVLDPLCYGGHHTFADSDNNGPYGTALVQEFIPHLERSYRLVSAPTARFLSGHSSGGWAGLWLQVAYPEFFGGVWSIAPDPVDFTDFQRIDLYKPGANMYVDEQGQRRPIARHGERILAWYDEFAKMEVVLGEGGQLRSFEWVFSRRGQDGLPEPLYDRTTGAVQQRVAEDWKRYDIRLILERDWHTLGPKLDNGRKLRVFMGDMDTFYLEGATMRLGEALVNLKSDAVVEIQAGKDHGSIASAALRKRIDRELLEVFDQQHRPH